MGFQDLSDHLGTARFRHQVRKSIEILSEYIRYECFSFDSTREPDDISHPDYKSSEQLSQRLRHEITEDREILEGAS
jgi:hypothetical protein